MKEHGPYRLRIQLLGLVQGMGFRPTVFKYAVAAGLSGFTRNSPGGIVIEVEGFQTALDRFKDELFSNLPAPARITEALEMSLPVEGNIEFRIIDSTAEKKGGSTKPLLPVLADIAICDDCRRELSDPRSRRFLYPLINCQNCGPRATIIKTLPYDRKRTVMSPFKMCPDCKREYNDPDDRRHHAEPCACHVCGPRLDLILKNNAGRTTRSEVGSVTKLDRDAQTEMERTQKIIARSAKLLASGNIVAIKGLGGFHLACDATNDRAVALLRKRKKRSNKPFAVMYPSIEAARHRFLVCPEEESELLSPAAPIVILREKISENWPGAGENNTSSGNAGFIPISNNVAPGLNYQGVMLPSTPLQEMLMQAIGRPLVMTSANQSNEPIAITNDDAINSLLQVADAFLVHDREIIDRYDDSLVFFSERGRHVMRRARGLAPLPLDTHTQVNLTSGLYVHDDSISNDTSHLSSKQFPQTSNLLTNKLQTSKRTVFGSGADLKSSFCFFKNGLFFPSQHIGDLEYPQALDHYEHTIKRYRKFFDLQPELVVHDLHPNFFSTKIAKSVFPRTRTLAVQHHHAHIASVIAEHVWDGVRCSNQNGSGKSSRDPNDLVGPVIGIAFDGTGYGTDGSIWGGEFLIVNGLEFKRAGHFKAFPLIGGDSLVRSPAKMAAQYLAYALGKDAINHKNNVTKSLKAHEWAILNNRLARNISLPMCSSVGRIFDIASALLGVCSQATYEGEAAMLLENIAEESSAERKKNNALPFNIGSKNETFEINLQETLLYLAEQGASISSGQTSRSNRTTNTTAARSKAHLANAFMQTIVKSTSDAAEHIRERTGINVVCLSGGAFQNRFLLENITKELENLSFNVYSNKDVPTGDGGIAVGQAYLATLAL